MEFTDDIKLNTLVLDFKESPPKVITCDIRSLGYDDSEKKYHILFNEGNTEYSYSQSRIKVITEHKTINPENVRIANSKGFQFSNIERINDFGDYLILKFSSGKIAAYAKKDLSIEQSALEKDKKAGNVFEYLRELSAHSDIKVTNKEDKAEGEPRIVLNDYYNKTFVRSDSALSCYLAPENFSIRSHADNTPVIFPFGINASQKRAVNIALSEQISIIQGPPGTGKTQTILNIISNLLLRGKTIIVVSNNNSAIDNVIEKLSKKPSPDIGFIAARLGSSKNKEEFIKDQKPAYPQMDSWTLGDGRNALLKDVSVLTAEVSEGFTLQSDLADLRARLSEVITEELNFKNIQDEQIPVISRKKTSSKDIYSLWLEFTSQEEISRFRYFLLTFKASRKLGVSRKNIKETGIQKMGLALQACYYTVLKQELEAEIKEKEESLRNLCLKDKLDKLSDKSFRILNDCIAARYNGKTSRRIFAEPEFRDYPAFLKEYPIVLSTTFSAVRALPSAYYDYIIMDEASQVDLITGALALSAAKNAVIVGDDKQLPAIIEDKNKETFDRIFSKYNIDERYHHKNGNSFLSSIGTIVPEENKTLLREHYRCHPKIIGFCNQKFYAGELQIMTEDKGEEVLSVVSTAVGLHRRVNRLKEHTEIFNERETETIVKEILPEDKTNPEEIGIIAPYRAQADLIASRTKGTGIEPADTVHKFQGREKDEIIFSVTDDQIREGELSNDPNLLNVAVSRAKKRFILVVTGNRQEEHSNITDLVSYIRYNKGMETQSNIHSVFDLLYHENNDIRASFLKKHRHVSDYDSENLIYAVIYDILQTRYPGIYRITSFYPLSRLIKHPEEVLQDSPEELAFACNPFSHIDFLIVRRIDHQAVAAIEVDGYNFHKEGTRQFERDRLKDSILRKYDFPLLRLSTKDSGEREKIINLIESVR